MLKELDGDGLEFDPVVLRGLVADGDLGDVGGQHEHLEGSVQEIKTQFSNRKKIPFT